MGQNNMGQKSGRHDSCQDIGGRLKEARWPFSSLAERKGILALQTEKQKGRRRNPRESALLSGGWALIP